MGARAAHDAFPDDVVRWRANAEECRIRAESMETDAARLALIGLADAYDVLADRAEVALRNGVLPRQWVAG
jgi:hypothetical protein